MPGKEVLKNANEKINKINQKQESKLIDDLLDDINIDDEYDY